MIILCPYCGHKLSKMLANGISSCDTCGRTFDSSSFYTMLSASWAVRRWYMIDRDSLKNKFELTDSEADVVCELVIDQCFDHDEFLEAIKKLRFT